MLKKIVKACCIGAVVLSGAILSAQELSVGGIYHFDEGSGLTVKDSSNLGLSGIIEGATWGEGKYGKGLVFKRGTGSCVSLPSYNFKDKMTLACWVKWTPDVYKVTGDIICKSTDGDPTGYRLSFSWHSLVFQPVVIEAKHVIPTGVWTHLALVADGKTLSIYVNGVLSKSVPATKPLTANGEKVIIGNYAGSKTTGYGWEGSIDEVYLLDKALSADDIKKLMNNQWGK